MAQAGSVPPNGGTGQHAARASGGDCERDGDIRFICGQNNPEDLAAVPQSPWVIASSYSVTSDPGYLSAVHQGTGETVRVYPDASAGSAPDPRYGGCEEKREAYNSHGIALLPGKHGIHTLAAVRHGGRDSIEVFRVDARGPRPTFTWLGCVLEPENDRADLNSVAWLPDGGFVATGFTAENVWEWQPDSGWSEILSYAGGPPVQPNGIEVSPNGKWLYIGAYEGRAIYRYSLQDLSHPPIVLPVNFKIDNLHWDDRGRLLAAGAETTPGEATPADCALRQVCEGIVGRAIRVDQTLENPELLFEYPGELFGLTTTAIQVNSRIWIGAFGPRIAVIKDSGRHS